MSEHIQVSDLTALARPTRPVAAAPLPTPIAPLGSRIAVARDIAFAFAYPALLQGWREAGAEIVPFSPLAGDSPDATADAVYLPGGYPELHAGQLAANGFLDGLRQAAGRNAAIYGECGGFMVLGHGLTDAAGTSHAMAGLLPVETGFANPRLHLGYRQVTLQADGPLGARGQGFRGHEFHYASILPASGGQALFQARNAGDLDLGGMGSIDNSVAGSFVHLIDRAGD